MYTSSDLTIADLTHVWRAVAWTRFILKDTEPPYEFRDTELLALLNLTAVTFGDGLYYRPHFVAATLVRSDPDRAISESIDNASKTLPDPDVIASRIMSAYAFIDEQINEITGRISSRRFEVVW